MTNRSRREFLKAGGLVLAGVGIAPLFGEAIRRIADEASVSSLFD